MPEVAPPPEQAGRHTPRQGRNLGDNSLSPCSPHSLSQGYVYPGSLTGKSGY